MVSLCLVQKLRNVFSSSSGFYALPRRWSSSQTCVIRGTNQDVTFPITMFRSLADHEALYPLATKIQLGRLIRVDPGRPSLINEHWRRILFSGFLHSYICKAEKDCIVNAFDFGNVGILKEPFNLLAFRKFDRVEGQINCDHLGYAAFIEELFNRFCGPSSLHQQFYECAGFVDACKSGKPEEVLRHHSFFLKDEDLANLYSDKHRLLRQELKHRTKAPEAVKILKGLEGVYSNARVVADCDKHILLEHLLGSHSPKLQQGGQPGPATPAPQQGGLPGPATPAPQPGGHPVPTTQSKQQGVFPGTALVDVHRIAVQHAIEDNVLTKALKMFPQEWPLLSRYTRVEVIRTLRYMFPDYPGQALFLFEDAKVFDKLEMARRLPTPSIYHYVTPASAE